MDYLNQFDVTPNLDGDSFLLRNESEVEKSFDYCLLLSPNQSHGQLYPSFELGSTEFLEEVYSVIFFAYINYTVENNWFNYQTVNDKTPQLLDTNNNSNDLSIDRSTTEPIIEEITFNIKRKLEKKKMLTSSEEVSI